MAGMTPRLPRPHPQRRRRIITAAILSGVCSSIWIGAGFLPGSGLSLLTVLVGLLLPAGVATLGLAIAEVSGATALIDQRTGMRAPAERRKELTR